MSLLAQLDQKIAANGGLIVSCQPVPDSPLDKPEIVAAMALAAEQAGAVAIRIEGVANLQATRAVVSVPIIGIVKRDLEDSPVRITAYIEDVDALAQAGADIIAILSHKCQQGHVPDHQPRGDRHSAAKSSWFCCRW